MMITQAAKPSDPPYPVMSGSTPIAKEFNKRYQRLWEQGQVVEQADFEQITTVLLEIFGDDYNKRHAPRKKARG